MTQVSISTLLQAARSQNSGLAAFNVVLVETAQGLVRAAEEAERPVVLQISENCVKYHGGLAPIAAATRALAEGSSAEVSVHLDHAEDVELIRQAVDLGFDSVMYDGSKLPDAENRRTTEAVVGMCRTADVAVEAELGEVGGKDGVHSPTARTQPDEARRFVEDTGVGSLAVAVGSSHAMSSRTASLDQQLIAELAEAVPVPLVLHGSSGVPDEELTQAITAGMTKINISTHVNGVFTAALRGVLEAEPGVHDPRRYVDAGRQALQQEARRLISLIAGTPLR